MKLSALLFCLLPLLSFYPLAAMAEDTEPSVEYGKKLFNDTSLGTNGKSCASCHNEEALKRFAAKDSYFAGEVPKLEDAVNFCIKGALGGRPERRNSVKLRSIALYIKSFKTAE